MNDFIPQLSYTIRGFYLVPVKVEYSKILYLFLRNQTSNIEISTSKKTNQNKNKKDKQINKEIKPLIKKSILFSVY